MIRRNDEKKKMEETGGKEEASNQVKSREREEGEEVTDSQIS